MAGPASPGTAQSHTQKADEGSPFAYPQTPLSDLELFKWKQECVSFVIFGSISPWLPGYCSVGHFLSLVNKMQNLNFYLKQAKYWGTQAEQLIQLAVFRVYGCSVLPKWLNCCTMTSRTNLHRKGLIILQMRFHRAHKPVNYCGSFKHRTTILYNIILC